MIEQTVANIALRNEAEMQNSVVQYRIWLRGLITICIAIHTVRICELKSSQLALANFLVIFQHGEMDWCQYFLHDAAGVASGISL